VDGHRTISDLESDALKSDADLTPLPEKTPSRLRGESLLVISVLVLD